MRNALAISAAIALATAAAPAHAGGGHKRAKRAASANGKPARKVVLAPLTTLGEEAKSKKIRAIQKRLASALAVVPNVSLVDSKTMYRAIKKAKKPRLRSCDGDAKCLAELGALLSAETVVYGEVGGLGDVQVIYLKAVNVSRRRELRSTTLELGGSQTLDVASKGAAYRLLDPGKYVGSLNCKVDVTGAKVFVDGKMLAKSPAKPIKLSVGTHALRVTHPEYRDFVRFVEVSFDKSTDVDVGLQQFPIIKSDMKSTGGPKPSNGASNIVYRGVEETPWYKKWYTVAGASAVVFIGSAILVGVIADGIDFDREKQVDPP